jgi:regulator of sirC expression with transglutaminase-like and TPR domain
MPAVTDLPDDDLTLERAAFDVEREGFDLFRAACLLPRIAGHTVDVQACVEQVEAWGALVRASFQSSDEDHRRSRLCDVVFRELGFVGDDEETDAPENSFLPDVLRRRRGLPITLSLVTLAVADAAGVRAFGVGLPRHFAVALGAPNSFVLLDVFAGGKPMTPQDIAEKTGVRDVEVLAEAIASTTPRAILMRMLANLHTSYLRRRMPVQLARVISRMLIFDRKNAGLLLQRAQLRLENADFGGAREDLVAARGLPLDDDRERVADDVERRLDEGTRYVH